MIRNRSSNWTKTVNLFLIKMVSPFQSKTLKMQRKREQMPKKMVLHQLKMESKSQQKVMLSQKKEKLNQKRARKNLKLNLMPNQKIRRLKMETKKLNKEIRRLKQVTRRLLQNLKRMDGETFRRLSSSKMTRNGKVQKSRRSHTQTLRKTREDSDLLLYQYFLMSRKDLLPVSKTSKDKLLIHSSRSSWPLRTLKRERLPDFQWPL